MVVLAGFIVAAIYLGILGFGAATMWRGLRGSYVDHDPRCHRCGYLLIGLPIHQANCPECGFDLKRPRAIRHGRRQRRVRPVLVGFLMVFLSLGPFLAPLLPQSVKNVVVASIQPAPAARAKKTPGTSASAGRARCSRCGRYHNSQLEFSSWLSNSWQYDEQAMVRELWTERRTDSLSTQVNPGTNGSLGAQGKQVEAVTPTAYSTWLPPFEPSASTGNTASNSRAGVDPLNEFASRQFKTLLDSGENATNGGPQDRGLVMPRTASDQHHEEAERFTRRHSSDGTTMSLFDVILAGGGLADGPSELQFAPDPTRNDQQGSLQFASASGSGDLYSLGWEGHSVAGGSELSQWQFSSRGAIDAQYNFASSHGALAAGYTNSLHLSGSHATLANTGIIRPSTVGTAVPSAMTGGRPVGGKADSR